MKAIDANVIARMLIGDDQEQARKAEAIVREGVFVPITVLLETAWLLRSRYRMSRMETATALKTFVDLPEVLVADPGGVAWALDRFAIAGDLADLIHLVDSNMTEAFVTFDRALAVQAGPDTPVTVETV